MNFNIFDRIKLNQEKKKYKYEFSEVIKYVTPEFIRLCENEEERANIYTHFNNELVAPEFPYFIELYKDSKLIAMNAIKYANGIDEEKVEFLKKNKTKLNILLENNIINSDFFHLGNEKIIDEYINILNHYGKEVIDILELKNFEYLNNENIKKLDIKIIKENFEIIVNTIEFLNEYLIVENQDILINLSLKDNEKFQLLCNYIKKANEPYSIHRDIFNFLELTNYDINLIDFIFEKHIKTIEGLYSYYNNTFNKEFEKNTGSIIIDYIIEKSKAKNDLSLYKNAVLSKIFGETSLSNFDKFLDCKDEEILKNIECFKQIFDAKSIKEIDTLIEKNNLNISKFEFQKLLFEYMHKKLKESVFIPPQKTSDEVEIIKAEDIDLTNFNMIVHVIKDRKSDGSPNGDFSLELMENPKLWNGTEEIGSDFLCCSYISENRLATFGGFLSDGVILGFSDIDGGYISKSEDFDAFSNMSGKGDDFTEKERSVSSLSCLPHQLNSNLRYFPEIFYNEITVGRTINNKKIIPSYMIVKRNFGASENNSTLNENTKKWAKYFNIPIIEIDAIVILKKAKKDLIQNLEELNNNNISLENFEKVLKNIRTIECCTNIPFNIFEVFNTLVDRTYNDKNNYSGLLDIINKYDIEAFINNEFERKTHIPEEEKERNKQIIFERTKTIKEKIEYLNKMYNMNDYEEEMTETHKLGFAKIDYIYSILFVMLIILISIMIIFYTFV